MYQENKKNFSPPFTIIALVGLLLLYVIEHITPHPKYANVFYKFGIYAEEKKHETKAEYFYKRAIHFDPTYARAYNRLGMIARNSGDMKEAIKYFQKAADFDSGFSDGLDNLGLIYMDKGYFDAAAAYFYQSIKRTPNNLFRYHLGLAYIKTGYKRGALSAVLDLQMAGEFKLANQLLSYMSSRRDSTNHD